MINDITLSYLIFLLPLFTFVVNGLFLGNRNAKAAAILAITCNGLAAASAITVAIHYFTSSYAPQKATLFEFDFLPFAGDLVAKIGMLVDPLSVMMLVVVTFISFMVNIYSLGYMREDRAMGRFFALLSLFSFSMLGLVVATNLFQMFIFWELVGVSSYLLIGFWYHKPSAVSASKQAFILTRFADSFFLLGIVLVSYVVGSFDFSTINSLSLSAFRAGTINLGLFEMSQANALVLGSVLIFTGGWGKSAMFPMHIWLPNAMEGPTPVSSIIHSATMVVAGVYLVARLFPFFAICGNTLTLIMWVGAFTMVFAAVIACTQKDIKRILAYSTLSQLGYMMFALGACKIGQAVFTTGWTASTFHIFTHAFFKCSLFLIAGSLIHQVHTNDLDAMGGLRKKMPITYICTLISVLAISGIPPFSGFFSKDEIILAAFQGHHYAVFALALLTSGLTTFYMFRLFFLAFHGEPRHEGVRAPVFSERGCSSTSLPPASCMYRRCSSSPMRNGSRLSRSQSPLSRSLSPGSCMQARRRRSSARSTRRTAAASTRLSTTSSISTRCTTPSCASSSSAASHGWHAHSTTTSSKGCSRSPSGSSTSWETSCVRRRRATFRSTSAP